MLASAPTLFAQEAGSTNAPASAAPAGGGERAGKWKAVFEQLDLSEAQKEQIKQIRASTQPGKERRQQIMAVLSPEQKQKLVSLLQEYRAGQAGQAGQ